MKKLVLLSVLTLFLLPVACFNSDDDESTVSYFVDYTLSDSGKAEVASGRFSSGPTDTGFESVPGCTYYVPESVKASASNLLFCFASEDPATYLDIADTNNVDGVFFKIYTDTSFTPGSTPYEVKISATNDGTTYDTDANGDVTITAYGATGGTVEGTYTATVSSDGGTTNYTVSGSFCLKRAADQLVVPAK